MPRHGIKAAVMRTGLSAHVLRVWEKRYGAVTPHRTDTNRRLYTSDDLERLQMLVALTQNGYSIGQIAHLKDEDLQEMVGNQLEATPGVEASAKICEKSAAYIEAASGAVRNFNQQSLEEIFDRAIKELGYSGLIEKVLIPLIQKVGNDWQQGDITTAGEHAASQFIKEYLSMKTRAFVAEPNAPSLLVTTPSGQIHELGAYIAGSVAKKNGWRVIYLGPSLPADEIAGAAEDAGATAVLLSIVYPPDDAGLPAELACLSKQLPKGVPIIVGGQAATSYQESLNEIGAKTLNSLNELTVVLDEVRKGAVA